MSEATRDEGLRPTNGLPADADGQLERKRFFQESGPFASHLAVVSAGGQTYVVNTQDQGIGRSLFVARYRSEMDTLAKAVRILDQLGRRDEVTAKTLLDVGANLGTTTITALTEYEMARAIAFEPAPDNFRLLRLNIAANDLESQVRALPVAISDRVGTVKFALHNTNWGDHRVIDRSDFTSDDVKLRPRIEVERTTLDQLVADGELEPSEIGLVWIDAQGHEAQIVQGGRGLLQGGAPIVLEFYPKLLATNGTLKPLIKELKELRRDVVDLRTGSADLIQPPTSSPLVPLADSYLESGKFTDLLLL